MSFYITLPSFPRPEFEDNTPSNFRVRLPRHLQLDGQGWKVGLASITLPNINFIQQLEEVGIKDNDNLVTVRNKTETSTSGHYSSKTINVKLKDLKERDNFQSGVDLFTSIAQIIDTRRLSLLDAGEKIIPEEFIPFVIKRVGEDFEMIVGQSGNYSADGVHLSFDARMAKLMKWTYYDKDDNLTQYFGIHLVPDFTNYTRPLQTELGNAKLFQVTGNSFQLTMKAKWRFVHLNRTYENITGQCKRTVYVYTNIGKSTIVGDQIVDLLREVEYDPLTSYHQYDKIHFEPKDIQYHDVMSTDMDIMEVQITETDNTPLKFGKGTTNLVLHFKRE